MIVPRFYPILDTSVAMRWGIEVVAAAEAILDAGAKILQFRHKGHFSPATLKELERIARMCHQAESILIVNDRADIARLVGAGVHLGQGDLTPSDARAVTGIGVFIGYSTHNERQLREALGEPVDYLALGPIFGTATKANPDPMVGIRESTRLRPIAGPRPLVAIGGITRANARAVLDAGANSVAIIGDLFPEDGNIAARAREWMRITG